MDMQAFKKAKAFVLRLLKLRPRSYWECSQKLLGRGYPPDVAAGVLGELCACGLIDDRAFARLWLQSRLRKYGLRRVMRELEAKGILRDQVNDVWPGMQEEYDEDTVIRAIAEKRMRVYQHLDPIRRRRRLMDYLARRGFGLDRINQVLRHI